MGKLRNYFLNHYPRTDFHELNQDWMISMLYDMINQVENFVEMNAVKYADPIQWDITRQYEKNTIVVDPVTGTAYISNKPVPMGVALSRTEYWSVIFDVGRFITLAASNFANSYEAVLTTTATMPTDKDNWVVWNSLLYRAKNDIHVGDRYVEAGNIERYTVEMFFNELTHLISEETEARIEADTALHGEIVDESVARENADNALESDIDTEARAREDADDGLQNNIDLEATAREDADDALQNSIDTEITARENADGDLSQLTTVNKSNLVSAINEVNTTGGGAIAKIGDLSNLVTTAKSNIVSAINETFTINDYQDVVGVKEFGAKCDGVTDDSEALINAISASYGKVLVINGDMLISKPIILYNPITIRGNGHSINIARDFSDYNMLVAKSVFGITGNNITIENLNFIGTQNDDLKSAIILNNSSNCTVNNCKFIDIRGCAVWVRADNYYTTINNCQADHCDYYTRQNGGGAFESALGSGQIVNHYITFNNCDAKNCGNAGFEMYDADNALITNCTASNMVGIGNWETGNGIMVAHNTTVSNCTVSAIENAGYYVTGNNNIIEGCRAINCGGMGIDLYTGGNNAYGNVVDGCSFESCGTHAHPELYPTSAIIGGTKQFRTTLSNINITGGGNNVNPVLLIGTDDWVTCYISNVIAQDVINVQYGISLRGAQRDNIISDCKLGDNIYVENYNANTYFSHSRSFNYISIGASSGETWTNETGYNLLVQVAGAITGAFVNGYGAGSGGLYFVPHNGTLHVVGTSLQFRGIAI